MRRFISAFILILLILPAAGYSQIKNDRPSPTVSGRLALPSGYSSGFILGFIDPSRITMRHSYSAGYSMGAGSGGYGLYMNHLSYGVNEKLLLNLDLGYVHDPFASFSTPSPAYNTGRFVGGGSVTYLPTDKMMINFSVNNYLNYSSNPMYGRWR